MSRLLRSPSDLNPTDIRTLYNAFDSPIAKLDCGQKCAPHNPNGTPFCCDICHAIPAAYDSEWEYLRATTDVWNVYRGDECPAPDSAQAGRAVTDIDLPAGMISLAWSCMRSTRSTSNRWPPALTWSCPVIRTAPRWKCVTE